ncbi:MAG: small, acid-soluble spore protein, alpha/beta type [Clostridium sp.]|uniref:small, acid-soluble spore protein, alpha/beta type n=1 Tax=Clostridium sp. TaxID=1506 RepID=UPI003EE67368
MKRKSLGKKVSKLEAFKHEVAKEIGVPLKEYNGDLTAKQCGAIGGEMVKRMVEKYEASIIKENKEN